VGISETHRPTSRARGSVKVAEVPAGVDPIALKTLLEALPPRLQRLVKTYITGLTKSKRIRLRVEGSDVRQAQLGRKGLSRTRVVRVANIHFQNPKLQRMLRAVFLRGARSSDRNDRRSASVFRGPIAIVLLQQLDNGIAVVLRRPKKRPRDVIALSKAGATPAYLDLAIGRVLSERMRSGARSGVEKEIVMREHSPENPLTRSWTARLKRHLRELKVAPKRRLSGVGEGRVITVRVSGNLSAKRPHR